MTAGNGFSAAKVRRPDDRLRLQIAQVDQLAAGKVDLGDVLQRLRHVRPAGVVHCSFSAKRQRPHRPLRAGGVGDAADRRRQLRRGAVAIGESVDLRPLDRQDFAVEVEADGVFGHVVQHALVGVEASAAANDQQVAVGLHRQQPRPFRAERVGGLELDRSDRCGRGLDDFAAGQRDPGLAAADDVLPAWMIEPSASSTTTPRTRRGRPGFCFRRDVKQLAVSSDTRPAAAGMVSRSAVARPAGR